MVWRNCMYTFVKKISMRIKQLSALFLSLIFAASCTEGNDKSKGDTTLSDRTGAVGENRLEDLLKIKDETELKSKFGKDHISYDTIWGAEGSYTMGSYIDKGTNDEVQIFWFDSLERSMIASASIHAKWNDNGTYNYSSKWMSVTGIKLGLTTDELEKLNGKTFTFSGFGWDYGGGIMSWNDGKLSTFEVGVTLVESEDHEISETEMNEILGDQEVKSDNAVVKKTQPRVNSVSVY